ncbi:MAG: hypothetical protein AB1540_00025 [Bdellovibrionota bacterium]
MTEKAALDESLKSFILEYIESVGQLEVLKLLATHPKKEWSASMVSQELRGNDSSTAKYLADFSSKGIFIETSKIQKERLYRYQPKNEELAAKVAALIAAYATYNLRIITLIYDRPVERLRGFADAFKIRKDPKDG